ncbi:hypothetical protein CCR95_04455 [Thiocystis minor]|uniref:hypothetical protein n=1 Tax=Thiocystis minor TaxID=61597 RepID=UPI0019140AD5|nr:hypothetical protein [Thiocystis minor]MBK5963359.1 hypothetical protein [Thiocystis minor]
MQTIRIDLRDVDHIDIQGRGHFLPPAPPKRRLDATEKKALDGALELWKLFNPQAEIFRTPIELSEHPPRVDIIPPSHVPVGLTPASKAAATLALGLNASAFAVVGISVGGGLYGSTNGELGVYNSGGLGLWSNIGVSAGPQYTFIFGPPSDFGGISWGVGCDVGPGLVSGGAMLLFSLPPFRCLGYSVSVSVGTTRLPFDVTVQASLTTTKPLLYFK